VRVCNYILVSNSINLAVALTGQQYQEKDQKIKFSFQTF
jgi:hypothetical protein